MKKIRLILLLLILLSFKLTQAQYSFNLDSLVRDLILPLTPPSPQSPFLYELSSHFLDEKYFSHTNNLDTFNSKIWYSIISEMKNAAYDTSKLPNSIDLRYKALNHKKNNIIPIGLIYADYHKFIDSVFSDSLKGVYFDWDDDNLWDVSNRISSPYQNKTLFVGSALESHSYFRTVKFIIDTSFIFYRNSLLNQSNSINFNQKLAIDFGDGLGYKLFRLDTITNYDVTFPDSGEYIINFALATPNNEGGYTNLTYISKSYFYVSTQKSPEQFNTSINVPGLKVSYILGCENSVIKKPLIYLEGFDYFEDRHSDKIYQNCLQSPRVVELLNYGYDLILVDWENSKADLRSNAMRVVHLIDNLKCKINASDESNELFVLMGESMGGLIGRMALAYMESDDYQQSTPIGLPYYLYNGELPPAPGECQNSNNYKNRKHNTRLFVSIDAPHQGAISPIGIQLMYKYFSFENSFTQELNNYSSFVHELYFNARYHLDNVAASFASKQMLIQEMSTGITNNEYTSNSLRNEFLETLYSLPNQNTPELKKGYPQECKLVAISNGLLTQQNQHKIGKIPANNGDELLHIFLDVKSTIFGFIKANRHQYDLHIYSVSNSNNPVFTSDKLQSKFMLRGCLRGLFKKNISCYKMVITKSESYETNNVYPHELSSGGNVFLMPSKRDLDDIKPKMDYFIFGYGLSVDYNTGNISLESKYLIDIITMKNVNLSFQTNACYINNIPVHSALDFDRKKIFDWDYPLFVDHADPNYNFFINKNFELTPFDVYCGGVNTDYSNPYTNINYEVQSLDKNTEHVYYGIFNDLINNNRAVNLEIGDSHMYLENFKIVANSLFWPSNEVKAGTRNPNYSYSNNPNSMYMYSRSSPLDWNNKDIFLKSNIATINSLNIINMEDRTLIDESGFEPCKVVYKTNNLSNNVISTNNLILYPNPNNGKFYIESIDFKNLINIELYNSIGSKLQNISFNINNENLYFDMYTLIDPGFYYIRLTFKNETQTIQFVKN